MERIVKDFVFAATGTTATPEYWSIQENGFIVDIIVEMPNFTNPVTGILRVLDPDDYELYAKELIQENATTHFMNLLEDYNPAGIPVGINFKLHFDISGAAGGSGGTVTTVLFIKQDGAR